MHGLARASCLLDILLELQVIDYVMIRGSLKCVSILWLDPAKTQERNWPLPTTSVCFKDRSTEGPFPPCSSQTSLT